jgi:deoxycytidylate deaminase
VKYKYPQIVSVKVSDLKMTPGRVYKIDEPIITSKRHRSFMRLAEKKAMESKVRPYRMAAVLVKGSRVLSIGLNADHKGYLKSKHYKCNQNYHAECSALMQVDPELLRGATVYVAGLSPASDGSKLCWSSRPCPSCQALLHEYGIKSVIFHNNQGGLHMMKVG